MKLKASTSPSLRRIAALLACGATLAHGANVLAQAAAPPPPETKAPEAAPAPPAKEGEAPAEQPPKDGAAPPAPAPATDAKAPAPVPADDLAPEKAKEITDALHNGNASLKELDLATAQSYFEQAFAKCDEHQVKGPLLVSTYMSLGALYAGYLQQVAQGTEFFKMGLGIDPKAAPDEEITNQQVTATLNVVRESLGIEIPKEQAEEGGEDTGDIGGFWVMKHEKPEKAKRMHPFGIFVETNPMVAIKGASLFFRFHSDTRYQKLEMRFKDNMYGMLIDCSAIALLDPKEFFYYIEVVGGDGSVIAREGDAENPVVLTLVPEAEFEGEQPNLPGLPPQEKCSAETAAPCPPWDPHCKDMPCATSEDCLAGKGCKDGFCVDARVREEGERAGPIGIVIAAGVGLGAGIALGDEEAIYWADTDEKISLAAGFSPSWMHTRAMAGYYLLENLWLGAFVRFQHINKDQWLEDDPDNPDRRYNIKKENYQMKVAGFMQDRKGYDEGWRGPMWGPTLAFFLWGDGKWFGPGQVVDYNGDLAEKQGFRAYSRFELNLFGAMYHEVSLTGDDIYNEGEDVSVARQHVSGMQGLGLGFGALYGVWKYMDLGLELMYDMMFPDMAHNFDLQFQLQFHF
jgi:hypothetical protein